MRSLVATAVAALVLICIQVGFFAARFSPHLLERDLAALPPILFTVFCVWLGRGGPTERRSAAPARRRAQIRWRAARRATAREPV